MHPGSLAILLLFGLPILVVGGTFVIVYKLITGGKSRPNEQTRAEETRLIQEVHQGLMKMEERIEALETILLDRDRKEEEK